MICVECTRAALGHDPSSARRYYLSSLFNSTAASLGHVVRAHWGTENGIHWVLDMAFCEGEARARTGHAAENLGTLRKIAINRIKSETSAEVGGATKRKVDG